MILEDDVLSDMTDPTRVYSLRHICAILDRARQQGHPIENGSYIRMLRISQIERLVEGRYDA